MNWIAIEGGRKAFSRYLRQLWTIARDFGLDVVARWRDESAGGFHATYGITNIQAALQISFLEEIRRGYAPKIAA